MTTNNSKNKSCLEAKKHNRTRKSKKYPFSSISYTTGDIKLNIDRFNKAMGSFGLDHRDFDNLDTEIDTDFSAENVDSGDTGGEGFGEALTEAKRYVRRYYIRPQNIFCSNKAEIIKTLIENENANCTVYTLNNLGDTKDVNKLMNSDIIYYYDDGILYDKNHVRIMDYELKISKEEKRKPVDVKHTSDKELANVYDDRTTEFNDLKEALDASSLIAKIKAIFAPYETGEVCVGDTHEIGDKNYYQFSDGGYYGGAEISIEKTEAGSYKINYCIQSESGDSLDPEEYKECATLEDAIDELQKLATYFKEPTISWGIKKDLNEAFNLNFDAVNAYGENLTESKEACCCICGEPLEGQSNDPKPYMPEGEACDSCFLKFVLPTKEND